MKIGFLTGTYSYHKMMKTIIRHATCLLSCIYQGCAHFAEFLQNISERQILWSFCSVVFRALTLKLPIQTSLYVVPKLPVSLSSAENCHKFRKRSTPQAYHLNVCLATSFLQYFFSILDGWISRAFMTIDK